MLPFFWSCLNACQNICTRIFNIATDRVIVCISSVSQFHLKIKIRNVSQTNTMKNASDVKWMSWEALKCQAPSRYGAPNNNSQSSTEKKKRQIEWWKEIKIWAIKSANSPSPCALSLPHTVWTLCLALGFTFSRESIYLFIYSVRSSSFCFCLFVINILHS